MLPLGGRWPRAGALPALWPPASDAAPPALPAPQATFLLLFVNTCGFVINKNQIPGGWNGVYWSNPMQVR